MKKIYFFLVAGLLLGTFPLVSHAAINDILVVGAGRTDDEMAVGEVNLYDATTGDVISSFTAYEENVGARLAVGDVNGDGNKEIVTIPWKQFKNPEIKIFDQAGNLLNSEKLLRNRMNKARKFDLAVGDINDDDVDEIVLARANEHKLVILAIAVTADNSLVLLDKHKAIYESSYEKNVWVELGNIDTANSALEIVTTPLYQGNIQFDIWKFTDSKITPTTSALISNNPALEGCAGDCNNGIHVVAGKGLIYAYSPLLNGSLSSYIYPGFIASDVSFFGIGKIGDLTLVGDNFAISSWKKNEITIYDATGEEVLVINTDSKGAFLDYIN